MRGVKAANEDSIAQAQQEYRYEVERRKNEYARLQMEGGGEFKAEIAWASF